MVMSAPTPACGGKLQAGPLDLATATLDDITAALAAKRVTSVQLTTAYLARISACQDLHAIISTHGAALRESRALDAERAAGKSRGPLHGVPVIIKDNIDLAGAVTTAGSLALADNLRDADAPLVARMKAAGLVVIAKANLTEWANFRSSYSSSGWSAVGGLAVNPLDPTRSACGSSSGSAAAIVAHLAPLAVGTETNGSIVCPASVTGIVGFKPTVGWVSQQGIVPISHTQDTAGPMAARVSDVAALLGAMVEPGRDTKYALKPDALKGARLGVVRFAEGFPPSTLAEFEKSLAVLRAAGAQLVDIRALDYKEAGDAEGLILDAEFKTGIDAYLSTTPAAVKSRTLAQLIEFNRNTPRELEWFGQDVFESSQATGGVEDPAYKAAVTKALAITRGGIDRVLKENDVVALVAPTGGPAWKIDLVNGDRDTGSFTSLAAIAGYPHLTVPGGQVSGLPVGLSFIGAADSDAALLSLGYAFERARPRN